MAANTNFELTTPVAPLKENKAGNILEIKDLKKILLAEKSADEAYKQVLRKYPDYQSVNDLKGIMVDHRKAIEFWKIQLRSKDIHIKEPFRPWISVVAGFSENDGLGREVLKALKDGEEKTLSEYEELLHSNKVNFQSISFIKNICLDQQRKHIAIIEGLLSPS